MTNNVEANIKSGIARRAAADAAAKKSARQQQGKPAKKSGSRSSAKSASRKAAGKASLRRAKQGCVVKSFKNRKGAANTLNYASDGDKNELIYSNCGRDNATQNQAFEALSKLRPDIEKNCGHLSINLPSNTNLKSEQYAEVVEFALKELEIDDENFAVAAYLHTETGKNHFHIAYSRVGYDSAVHASHNIGDLAMAVAERIENKFNLTLNDKPSFNVRQGWKPCPAPALAQFERQQKELKDAGSDQRAAVPAFVQLQLKIANAIENSKNANEFKVLLAKQGVEMQLNIQQKDGLDHISGITYSIGEFKINASSLGKPFEKYGLRKAGIDLQASLQAAPVLETQALALPNNDDEQDRAENAWHSAQAEIKRLEDLKKRVQHIKTFERHFSDPLLENRFKHQLAINLDPAKLDPAHIADAENKAIKTLLIAGDGEVQIAAVLGKSSLTHPPMPEPIPLFSNSDSERVERAQARDVEILAIKSQDKIAVEKAANDIAAERQRQQLHEPAPEWQSPAPK